MGVRWKVEATEDDQVRVEVAVTMTAEEALELSSELMQTALQVERQAA